MNHKTKCILIALILGLVSVAHSSEFKNPYKLRDVKFSKKPKLDEWCDVSFKLVCDGDYMIDSLPLKFIIWGIQTDQPNEQMPKWYDIRKDSEKIVKIRIRPYFYGWCKLGMESFDGDINIGINDKGKCTFAGGSAELGAKLGKPEIEREVITMDGPLTIREYSPSQTARQRKLLSVDTMDGNLYGSDYYKNVKFIKSKKGILKSIRGGGNILRYDFYLSPLPEWGKKSKLKIKLVTRRNEPPKVEVYKRFDWKLFLINDTIPPLKYSDNAVFILEFKIKPIKASGQHAWFKFVYNQSDSTVRGFDIYFDEKGILKPLE
ncbi:hypothetical protein HZA73_08955 [candidate division TA06 bacterium]|nr:hypothetical protein [candidate division TA06 bacterium]